MSQSPPVEPNPPARTNLSNSHMPQQALAQSSPGDASGSVKPVFCCSVSPEGFFKFYTIFLIATYGLDFLGTILFSFKSSPLVGIFGLASDVPMLILASIAYSKYDDTGNYGQGLHYCYAITVLVFAGLALVAVAMTPVFILAFGVLNNVKDTLTQENTKYFWMGLSLYTIVVVPLSFYNAYLGYLYFSVISWKRSEGKGLDADDTQNMQELEDALADEKNQSF